MTHWSQSVNPSLAIYSHLPDQIVDGLARESDWQKDQLMAGLTCKRWDYDGLCAMTYKL